MCQLCTSLGYNTHLLSSGPDQGLTVSAAPAFGLNQIVNQLRTQWDGAYEGTYRAWFGTNVTYSIADFYPANAGYVETGAEIMSAVMKGTARLGFELWDDAIAINLNEAVNSSSANITMNYANYTLDKDGFLSTAGGTYARPTLGGQSSGYYQITSQQIWLNKNWQSHDQDSDMYYGSYGVATFVHEIGHTLGLSHPGTYNAGRNPVTYAANAEFAQDNRQYTIMSYFGGYNPGTNSWTLDGTDLSWYYPSTPMVYDIAAIQATYGADFSTRAGSSTYGFNITSDVATRSANGLAVYSFSQNAHPIFTIWDGGGIDTLDCSGYSATQRIDLTAGNYSSIGGLNGNIGIAYGCTIENAFGGSGFDTITGNGAANLLRGNGGSDTIDGGDGVDTAIFAGNRSAYVLTDLGGGSVRVTGPDGTDTLTRVERLQFNDQTIDWPPRVTDDFADSLSDATAPIGTLTVGSTRAGVLEVAGDRDLFAVQLTAGVNYLFKLNDKSSNPTLTLANPYLRYYDSRGNFIGDDGDGLGGHGYIISIKPATTSTYYFSVGASGDAYAGTYQLWIDRENSGPKMTPQSANMSATAGQSFAVSNLFSSYDADGDTLSYYLYDSNTSANSGHFVVNGAIVPGQTIYPLTAAQLAQATFVAGAAGTSDDIYVQAYDGKEYSGWNTSVHIAVPGVNHTPTVNRPAGANVAASAAHSLNVSSLFSGSDLDGDSLTYFLYDANAAGNSGHFVVGGNNVPAQTIYAVTAAQLAQTTFVAGAAGIADDIYVMAYDGKEYSGWNTSVHVTATGANNTPTVNLPSGASVTTGAGQPLNVSTLFSGSDLDGDVLTYFLYDANPSANSGHFVVNGVTVPADTIYKVSAAQLAQATFVAGAAGVADDIHVMAYDGNSYSGWNTSVHVTATGTNHAPTVNLLAGASAHPAAGQSLQLSSLFSGSDVDGNSLSYFVYDSNSAANSGHFVIGGNTVAGGTITAMSAAQLAQATFVAGAAGTADDIYVMANDSELYSGWNTSVHVFV